MNNEISQEVHDAKEQGKEELLAKKNVVAVGVGHKNLEGEEAVIVFVEKKEEMSALDEGDAVPREINGVKTDVIEIGELRPMTEEVEERSTGNVDEEEFDTAASPSSHRRKRRPLVGGITCMWGKGSACTLGAIVFKDGKPYALQNAHCGFPHWRGAQVGDAVLQPSPNDGGDEKDVVGKSFSVLELDFSGAMNPFDAALVELDEEVEVRPLYQYGIGEHKAEMADVKIGDKVKKSGRTTGVQESEVIAVNVSARINYSKDGEERYANFDGQIFARNADSYFCDGGDSSSLVLDAQNRPVGLLYAGSDTIAIFSPIKAVMSHFGASFTKEVPAPPAPPTPPTPPAPPATGEGFIALRKSNASRDLADLDEVGNEAELRYRVNMRKEPSLKGEVIRVLPVGTRVRITEERPPAAGYDWAKVVVIS